MLQYEDVVMTVSRDKDVDIDEWTYYIDMIELGMKTLERKLG